RRRLRGHRDSQWTGGAAHAASERWWRHRSGGRAAFGVWGLIGELLVLPRFRIVGEIAGESVTGQRPNNSALVGVIWQPSPSNVFFDAGVRRGLTRGAPDWLFTVGVTFGFTVPLGTRESPQ